MERWLDRLCVSAVLLVGQMHFPWDRVLAFAFPRTSSVGSCTPCSALDGVVGIFCRRVVIHYSSSPIRLLVCDDPHGPCSRFLLVCCQEGAARRRPPGGSRQEEAARRGPPEEWQAYAAQRTSCKNRSACGTCGASALADRPCSQAAPPQQGSVWEAGVGSADAAICAC